MFHAARCPLCRDDIPTEEQDGWRRHLLDDICRENPRTLRQLNLQKGRRPPQGRAPISISPAPASAQQYQSRGAGAGAMSSAHASLGNQRGSSLSPSGGMTAEVSESDVGSPNPSGRGSPSGSSTGQPNANRFRDVNPSSPGNLLKGARTSAKPFPTKVTTTTEIFREKKKP